MQDSGFFKEDCAGCHCCKRRLYRLSLLQIWYCFSEVANEKSPMRMHIPLQRSKIRPRTVTLRECFHLFFPSAVIIVLNMAALGCTPSLCMSSQIFNALSHCPLFSSALIRVLYVTMFGSRAALRILSSAIKAFSHIPTSAKAPMRLLYVITLGSIPSCEIIQTRCP